MTSINTNAAALTALRTLQATSTSLELTQSRISTGYKIGSAKDNAAYWSITTALKSDNKSLGTVKDALGLGAATVDVAYQGLTKAKDVLDEIKAKLTSATQAGVDRNAVQADLSALQDQLRSIASSSNFSGENWLQINSAASTYDPNKTVVASFARDSNNAISIGTIKIDTSKTALFDSKAGSSAGIINSQSALSADGEDLGFGGTPSTGTVPFLQGFDTAQSFTSQIAGSAEAAEASLGEVSPGGIQNGDRLTFDLTVDGVKKSLTVALTGFTAGMTSAVAGAALATAVNTAITSSFGGAVATAAYDATKKFTITSATQGATSEITVSGLKAVDGSGAAPATNLGFANVSAFDATTDATARPQTTFTYSATAMESGDILQFDFVYNGDRYTTASRTLNTADTGSAAGYATALQTMVNTAKRISDNVSLGTGKLIITEDPATAGNVLIKSSRTGPSQSFQILAPVLTDATTGSTTTFDGGGLGAVALVTGVGVAPSTTVTYTVPSGASIGDSISFDMTTFVPNADDTAAVAVKKSIRVAAGATAADMATNLQAAFDTAFGTGVLSAVNALGVITIKTLTAGGPHTGFTISAVQAVDGDGVPSGTGLSTAGATDLGRGLIASDVPASAVLGSTFGGPVTFDATGRIRFDIAIDGTTSKVRIDKATIDAALPSSGGVINTADDFALVVAKALDNAGVGGLLDVTNSSGTITIAKKVIGTGSVEITDANASAGGSLMAVSDIDLTSSVFTSLTDKQKASALTAYISVVNDALTKVISAAASLGSVSSRIDMQSNFVTTLMDTIDKGVGQLIDADVSEESTKLQALQVKQQLGVQALSIANASSQNILQLFNEPREQ